MKRVINQLVNTAINRRKNSLGSCGLNSKYYLHSSCRQRLPLPRIPPISALPSALPLSSSIHLQQVRNESTTELPNREELQHGVYEMKDPVSEDQVVNISVINKDGKEYKLRGKIGDNLLYLAKRFEVEMEGACEASLACTTCHVYVDSEFYDKLETATEKEEDLLDMAPFLKENSRLGCQIILRKDLQGLKVTLPAATKNFYVDGHKPSHH